MVFSKIQNFFKEFSTDSIKLFKTSSIKKEDVDMTKYMLYGDFMKHVFNMNENADNSDQHSEAIKMFSLDLITFSAMNSDEVKKCCLDCSNSMVDNLITVNVMIDYSLLMEKSKSSYLDSRKDLFDIILEEQEYQNYIDELTTNIKLSQVMIDITNDDSNLLGSQ